jgi:diguanylate cyclase (GGDEF)-like protein
MIELMETRMSTLSSKSPPNPLKVVSKEDAGLAAIEFRAQALEEENQSLRAEVARLRQYRMLAYRDPLTGLRNRRYFDERLAEECDRARRTEGSELSLLVIDIDEFKVINDLEGHLAGDRVLQWVANFLNQNIRTHDTCCRTGGDEFMIILSNTNRIDCEHIRARIEKNLKQSVQNMPAEIALSIGAATWPRDGTDLDGLVSAADQAMYKDKHSRPRSHPELYPLSFAH